MATKGTLLIQGWIKCIQSGEFMRFQREVGKSLKEQNSVVQDESGRNILHWAASLGSLESVQWLLLQKKLDVNSCDDTEWTPLIIASSAGHEKIVEVLLSSGASVNAVTNQGRSSFFYACSRNWLSIVRLLVDANADVNVQDSLGASSLHRATGIGHAELLGFFLEHLIPRVEPNLRDNEGNTPLHIACETANYQCLEILLKMGAHPSILNKEEKMPFEMASPQERKKLQTIIERHAANEVL